MMNKLIVTVITAVLFICIATISFAASEFQIKGTVTKINGNQITVKDDKSGEITVESHVSGIKIGDVVLLKGEISRVGALRTSLSTQDIDFLAKQCLIDQADVDIISQLEVLVQGYIGKWIDAGDCKKFTPFKVSRSYYRQLRSDKPIPLAPAGWDISFLTSQEFKRYVDILENAPW